MYTIMQQYLTQNVRIKKKPHNQVTRKILNFDSDRETLPYKIFDFSVKISTDPDPFKSFTDNSPNHSDKKAVYVPPCGFFVTIRA